MILSFELSAWKKEISLHKNLIIVSLIFFLVAVLATYTSGTYADRYGNSASSDLILNNLPSVNLGYLYSYGFIFMFLVLLLYPLFFRTKYLHVVISQLSLLMLVRSIFMILTHLKVPSDAIITDLPRIFSFLNFHNDLFFSGHTAVPFLGFLLYKEDKIRYFFMFMTILLGVTVLLMHVHYSIDVFSAFFITYGTYEFGKYLFRRINHYDSSQD